MRKFTLTAVIGWITIMTNFAQAPQSFKYQAVARNASGEILMEQIVSFRIGILQDSAGGILVYSETHLDTTNQFGLVSLEIGNGTVISGVFEGIDWGEDNYFLQIEMDETGGETYQLMGTTQLMSVPFSLNSKSLTLTSPDGTSYKVKVDDNGNLFSQKIIPGCGMPFTDARDGQTYNTVQVGNQCWMAQNLNVGTKIPAYTQESTNNGIIEKYCYNDDEAYCTDYGGLYKWDEMMEYTNQEGIQGICPEAWHIPTDAEWMELVDFTGGLVVAGGKLKEEGFDHWLSPNTGATNESGITALGAGFRSFEDHIITDPGTYANLWTSTDSGNGYDIWICRVRYNSAATDHLTIEYLNASSVRCLKDN